MATLFRRGKTWWLYTSCKGKRHRWSLRTTDERIAKQKLRKLEYELQTRGLELPTVTPLEPFLESFCEHFETTRTRKGCKNDISYLRTVFGPVCPALEPRSTLNQRHKSKKQITIKDKLAGRHIKVSTLEDITPGMIDAHIIQRMKRDGIGPKTANRIREVLHVMFNYAIRQHGFRAPDGRFPNPADAVTRRREHEPEIRYLSIEEIGRQLDVLADHPVVRVMAAVYIYAGLRREEAIWLTSHDVDLKSSMIRVCRKTLNGETWTPKTKRNRRIPISSALRLHLQDYSPPATSSWLFASPRGKRWDPDNFSQRLREINVSQGLKWSCLDYRHTFGSQLAMKGESLYKISELMGNSPDICRRHYAALVPEKMRDTVEFDSVHQPGPSILRMAGT